MKERMHCFFQCTCQVNFHLNVVETINLGEFYTPFTFYSIIRISLNISVIIYNKDIFRIYRQIKCTEAFESNMGCVFGVSNIQTKFESKRIKFRIAFEFYFPFRGINVRLHFSIHKY